MEKIAVIGLGYVGLPVALAFANKFPDTIGFDINSAKVDELRGGIDRTGECAMDELTRSSIHFTSNPEDMRSATFFVIAVPTPIDKAKRPDLSAVKGASEIAGRVLQPGAVVVYESTVYPGVTEDICGPILAKESGLKQGADFKLGYSPERINPGDKEHCLHLITKIVSGEDEETLERVADTYGKIIDAGVHRASSIKVAEAAKVIENTQRDLNIALMNELAHIFDLMNIPTKDVLDAAGTKWNFLKFTPGLVGGHCIGVDPYYLTAKAEELGYHPQVILAGRRINDEMGKYIAGKMIKMMIRTHGNVRNSYVGVLGLTFKENVPDLRNSRIPDIISELEEYGVVPLIHDPMADPDEAKHEYGIDLVSWDDLIDLDGMIFAVPHKSYLDMGCEDIVRRLKWGGVLVDVKSALDANRIPDDITYYRL